MANSEILERYLARTPRSKERADAATRWLPGGDTRSTTWFGPYPIFVERGEGAEVVDLDGNRYLDLLNNYTSLIHGHSHPKVVEAVEAVLRRGFAYASPHEGQLRLAQILCERYPSVERARFCNSGTEAVMFALRAARAYTGRPLVAKAEGGFHGTWDSAQVSVTPDLAKAGPRERPARIADTRGLIPGTEESTVVIPFNDLAAAEAILEEAGDRLAAIIVEPVQGVGGLVPAEREYLQGLREIADRLGALLVFDEIICLRVAHDGAQGHFGVTPDLTTMGKIIGGGLPVGGIGGRQDVMDLFNPSKPGALAHSGTFNGQPLMTAAGIATMELLTPEAFDRLAAIGERMRDGINALGEELGLGIVATGLGSLVNVHLADPPIRHYRDSRPRDVEATKLFHLACLNEGLFLATRGMMALSTPMTDEDVERTLEGIRAAALAVHAERPLPAASALVD